MDLKKRLDELLRVAEVIGLVIRRTPMGGEGGGYCVVKGRRCLFVDIQADLETCYERTLEALAPLLEMKLHGLHPEVREDIEREQSGLHNGSSHYRDRNG